MANSVFNVEEITLQDGTDVVLKPMVVSRLKRFMKAWGEFADVTNDEEGYNVFINCCGIALEENFKGKFDALKASPAEAEEGEHLNAQYKAYLEDTLELDSIYKVLDVCGGLKLNDPKLMEAAAAAAAAEQDGTN